MLNRMNSEKKNFKRKVIKKITTQKKKNNG